MQKQGYTCFGVKNARNFEFLCMIIDTAYLEWKSGQNDYRANVVTMIQLT